MINNRIYEALACGAVVLSDPHPGLESSALGAGICFVHNQGAAAAFLDRFFSDAGFAQEWKARAGAAGELVLREHTYEERAARFIAFYRRLAAGHA